MHTENIEYQAGDTALKGYLTYDPGQAGKKPAILVIHDWSGCNDFVRQKAEQLARLGYVGFAVDMYGDGKTADSIEDKMALMQPLLDNRPLLLTHITAALDTIKTVDQVDPAQIAAIGFCFGGLCGLDLARSGANIKGIVSFHGALKPPPAPAADIKAKILALHGYDDPMVPPEDVLAFTREMTKAKADWQVHIYGNTSHAFTNPKADNPDIGLIYNNKADTRSWQAMQNFLTEIFA